MSTTITMKANQMVDVEIEGQLADGTTAPIQNAVTWQSMNPSIVTVEQIDQTHIRVKGTGTSFGGPVQVIGSASGIAAAVILDVTTTNPVVYATKLAVKTVGSPVPLA